MNTIQDRFVKMLEGYYRDEYPGVMLAEVARIIPADREMLSALYQIVIRRNPAKYKSVPDVAAIEEALRELYDAYPEYRSGVRYTPPTAQLDDGGGIPAEVGDEYVEDLMQAFYAGELRTADDRSNPDDHRPTPEEFQQQWLHKRGYVA
jgi:hypothetical protein